MRFAYEVVKGMRACGLDKMNYEDFPIDYQLRHGNAHSPNPVEYGYPTIDRLFNAIRIGQTQQGQGQADDNNEGDDNFDPINIDEAPYITKVKIITT